jgi:alpha/beta superfamily hydrolase
MTKVFHRSLFLAGPAGRLEAMLWTAREAHPPRAALICHPHPLYGGTLHNKVVFQAAKSLHRLGLPVLRFNFRGAGASAGTHDGGRGEAEDVRAALGHLAAEFPGAKLVLAGFSFGAWVGLRVACEEGRVTKLIGLGLPVNNADVSYLRDCRKPKLFIHGSEDEHGAIEKVAALFEELPEPKRLEVVEGADHFFTGKLSAVDAAIRTWMRERQPE